MSKASAAEEALEVGPRLRPAGRAGSTLTAPAPSGVMERLVERIPWGRDVVRRRFLAVADVLSALLALAILTPSSVWLAVPITALGAMVIAKVFGLYDSDHRSIRHLTIDELPAIAGWALIATAGLGLWLDLTSEPVSLEAAGRAALLAAASCLTLRGVARWAWRRAVPPERTALLGEGALARITLRKLGLFRDMHLDLASVITPPSTDAQIQSLTKDFDRIVVADDRVDPDLTGALAVACRNNQAKLSVVSPLRGRALPGPEMSKLADLSVFEFDTWDVSRSTRMLKRLFDLTFSGIGLLLAAPLFPLIAIAIRLDSPGRVIFVQVRAGVEGRAFRMFKFRTMTADAEARLGEVVSLDDLEEPMFKVRGDPRVTRVGRHLRRFSLDELPQLWNVLRGDMSFVGPRPEQLEVVRLYRPEHQFRLDVKPGLTGPMQVHGRGELTFEERLAVELEYIENPSLARDLRILALTIPGVLRGTGAY